MGVKKGVSVIIPVLNEVGNIQPLILRLRNVLGALAVEYEIIFIDDHSSDGTKELIETFATTGNNVRLYEKIGQRGKAYSIIEGVERTRYNIVCMIDADLQYAPENIPPMVKLMEESNSDVVITNRKTHATSPMRKLMSFIFNTIFIRMLFGINYDTQSGLKVFRRKVFKDMHLSPSPWSFDLEFIVRSLLGGYSIISYDIAFGARQSGDAKVNTLKTSFELARSSIKLRFQIPASHVRKKYKSNEKRLSIVTELL